MNIQTINYKKVKCPKCGKSYFKVKENNDFNIIPLVFKEKTDPIYKDGELQNPTEAEPIKERCECLECGCNFRVEIHDVFGEYKFIDEDGEEEENRKRLEESFQKLKEETKKSVELTETLTIGDPCITEGFTLNFPKSSSITIDDCSSFVMKSFEDTVKEELDGIKERLDKLERKNN